MPACDPAKFDKKLAGDKRHGLLPTIFLTQLLAHRFAQEGHQVGQRAERHRRIDLNAAILQPLSDVFSVEVEVCVVQDLVAQIELLKIWRVNNTHVGWNRPEAAQIIHFSRKVKEEKKIISASLRAVHDEPRAMGSSDLGRGDFNSGKRCHLRFERGCRKAGPGLCSVPSKTCVLHQIDQRTVHVGIQRHVGRQSAAVVVMVVEQKPS